MASNALRPMTRQHVGLLEFKPSMTAYLFKSFTGWITLLLVLALSIPLFGIPLLWLGWKALDYRMTHFELSGQRLFIRKGIVSRTEEEIELYRVKDVRADFSIIQQLFGVGNIQIISSDATGSTSGRRSNFRVPDLYHAREIREEIRDRVEQARLVKGVREFDTV